ncbi:hypothetical protein Y032_0577g223 [Ancylostoma ceylanicum]|uniref:Uncharacterized protein n=1 Tax=Ancylostoma ceylanicum TaxID=53326 RepID=A0A016WQA6_9BILA|nr:hypothetical protein Y032_0577g223 [Ancylostoma ceylanicum]
MSEELVNPVELEALLLDEPTQSEQLAAMKATLDKLMHAVQGIAKQNVAQITVSKVNAMLEELVNPVELEALLLDEPTKSEQLAAMKATLDKLMHAV